jgi:hypothetical protein
MKKFCSALLCAVVPVAVSAGDLTNAEILKRIEEMQTQIRQQQVVIDRLKGQLDRDKAASDEAVTEIVRKEVDAAVEKGLAQVKQGPTLSLGKNIDGLKLKGDLRLRYERREETNDEKSGSDKEKREKDRFRTRFRLGFVWNNSTEEWEIGAGLASGSDSGKSTNDSWNKSSVWETGDIRLDYAYAKHRWDTMSLTLGQQKNPFETTFIMFDGDLRPTGATLEYTPADSPVFVTAGIYNIRGDSYADGDNDQSLANMYAAQVGLKGGTEAVQYLLALACYNYDSETTEYFSEAMDDAGYEWQIADIYGHVTTKVGDVGLKLYGQYAVNLGVESDGGTVGQAITLNPDGKPYGKAPSASYDAEDEDQAWVVGIEAKYQKMKLSYAYAHIEGDAIPLFVSDSDFGAAIPGGDNSINVEGHKFGLSYSVTKNFSVGGTVFLTELIDEKSSSDLSGQLCQLDLKYKF